MSEQQQDAGKNQSPGKAAGKGRPTPKRSEAVKRRSAPVGPPPTSRRAAAKQLRAKQAENRKRVRQGTLEGDERVLLKRDQGPVRKYVRNYIDARRSLGWILLPIALIVVGSGLTNNQSVQAFTFSIWIASFLAVALEMLLVGWQLRTALRRTFPDEKRRRGHVFYGLMRTTVMRRFRVPRPVVRP